MTVDPVDVAQRWRDAVARNDMDCFSALYAPGASVWVNTDRRLQTVAEHVTKVARFRTACERWAYTEVRCQRTETGFVSQHTVVGVAGGREWSTVAALIALVQNGQIVHLDEYLAGPVMQGSPAAVPSPALE